MKWSDIFEENSRSECGGDPLYPTISTSNPSFAKDKAWYCILGLLPMSPNTMTHALFVDIICLAKGFVIGIFLNISGTKDLITFNANLLSPYNKTATVQ